MNGTAIFCARRWVIVVQHRKLSNGRDGVLGTASQRANATPMGTRRLASLAGAQASAIGRLTAPKARAENAFD
jgi:hypothetical protein